FERRLVLLEIHRDLLVGHAPQQRPDEERIREQRDDERETDAEGEDRFGREPHPLQRDGRQHQRRREAPERDRRAAERQLQSPPAPDLVDDRNQLRPAVSVLCHDTLAPFCESRFESSVSAASSSPPATSRYHHSRCACACASSLGRALPSPASSPGARPATAAVSSRGSSGDRSESVRSTLLASVVAASAPAPCVRTS